MCSGNTGATGSDGVKGARGDVGDTGATGATGVQVIKRRVVRQAAGCPGRKRIYLIKLLVYSSSSNNND